MNSNRVSRRSNNVKPPSPPVTEGFSAALPAFVVVFLCFLLLLGFERFAKASSVTVILSFMGFAAVVVGVLYRIVTMNYGHPPEPLSKTRNLGDLMSKRGRAGDDTTPLPPSGNKPEKQKPKGVSLPIRKNHTLRATKTSANRSAPSKARSGRRLAARKHRTNNATPP